MTSYQIVPGLKKLADLVARLERRITKLEIKMDLRTKPTSAEINEAHEDFIRRTSPDPKP
ncbi:MAG: hypothetical protein ACR2RF_08150 [Geminicoccaceae bacterium]